MPSCSQAMQHKTIASCPTHSDTHWECCSWAYEEKKRKNKKQPADQCQPMRMSNTDPSTHSSWPLQTGRRQNKKGLCRVPQHPPLPKAQDRTLCQICLKSSESLDSAPLRHLLETSLHRHRWTSQTLPSNKQSETLSYWSCIKTTAQNLKSKKCVAFSSSYRKRTARF